MGVYVHFKTMCEGLTQENSHFPIGSLKVTSVQTPCYVPQWPQAYLHRDHSAR